MSEKGLFNDIRQKQPFAAVKPVDLALVAKVSKGAAANCQLAVLMRDVIWPNYRAASGDGAEPTDLPISGVGVTGT